MTNKLSDTTHGALSGQPEERAAYMMVLGSDVIWPNFSKNGLHYRTALDRSGLYAAAGARYIVEKRPIMVLEGDFDPSRLAVAVRFPDYASVKTFWHSETYQTIRLLRDGAGALRIGVWKGLSHEATLPLDEGAVMLVIAEDLEWRGYQPYLDAVRISGILRQFGGVPLAAGPPSETLEGRFPPNCNTVLIRFPSPQAIIDFWQSDAYRQIRKLRDNAGRLTVAVWDLSTRS